MWVYPGLTPGDSVLTAVRIIIDNLLSLSQFSKARKEELPLLQILFPLTQFFLSLILNYLAKV